MRGKPNRLKRTLSLVLALILVLSCVPTAAFAQENTAEEPTVPEIVETTAPEATEEAETTPETTEAAQETEPVLLIEAADRWENINGEALCNAIPVRSGQLIPETCQVAQSDIYAYVVNYPLRKGHTLSISDKNYVFSVRKLSGGNYSAMLKQATASSFTATEDMTIGMLIRKPDKSLLTAEELENIVIYDSQYGMTGVDGYAHRFTVEAETVDGGTATTRAAIFLPDSYTETGTPTRLIVMTNGYSAYLTDSVWNGNTADNVGIIRSYLDAGYAVYVVDNTAARTAQTPDLGCPQLVDSYLKAYDYIRAHFNVEQQFSIHSRSFGTFAAMRIMQEVPELVKCAVMTGPRVSLALAYSYVDKAFVANRFGFADPTGAAYEADKLAGHDPYTDVNGDSYILPPTYWAMSRGDDTEEPMEVIEKLIAHGNDVTFVTHTGTDHTGVCTLNTKEMFSGALAFLESQYHTHAYTSVITAPTCTEQGYTTHTCACGDSFVDSYVGATGHAYENGACAACGAYAWDTDGDGVLEILAIGNSFSVDALEYAYQIAQDLGIEEIVLGNLYIGGCSLETHAENAAGDLAKYTYYYNDNGTWKTTSSYKISTALESRSWDYVSMQQASNYSGVESTYNEDLTSLINYVQERSDAKLVWHMTWAYQQNSTHSAFPTYGKDQMTMYNAIVSAAQNKIVTNSNIDLIVPNGTAVQNSRTSLLGDTTTRDGHHMSYDYGRYLTGLMFIKTITGLPVDSVTYTPSGVDAQEKAIAIESVNNAYDTPFAVTISVYVEENPCDKHLQQLPENICPGTNLWPLMEHDNEYYTGSGWGNSSKNVYSVTFPVIPGDQIWATSFCNQAVNGLSGDATRITWFDENGVLISPTRDDVYAEFTKYGYVTAPKGATAVNIPMATDADTWELYILNRDHYYESVVTPPTCTEQGYTTHTCHCGDSFVDSHVAATGEHSYGDWTVVDDATRERICDFCADADRIYRLTLPTNYSGPVYVENNPSKFYAGTRNVAEVLGLKSGTFTDGEVTVTIDGTNITVSGTPAKNLYFDLQTGEFGTPDYKRNVGYSLPDGDYRFGINGSGTRAPTVCIRYPNGSGNLMTASQSTGVHTVSDVSGEDFGVPYLYFPKDTAYDYSGNLVLAMGSNAFYDNQISQVETVQGAGEFTVDGYLWTTDETVKIFGYPVSSAEKETQLVYTPGSKEYIRIYLPQKEGYLQIRMNLANSTSTNAYGWRLDMMYACDDNYNEICPITQNGEYEAAIKLKGRPDFMGMGAHGSERMTSFAIYVDGEEVTLEQLTALTRWETVKMVRYSDFYDPADETTVVAHHAVEYHFDRTGLTVDQNVEWLTDETCAISYMMMFPVRRTYENLQITDTYIDDYDPSGYDVSQPDFKTYPAKWTAGATKLTLYSEKSGVTASMESLETSELTGTGYKSCSNSSSYNKLYFTICGGGSTEQAVTPGDVWSTSTRYEVVIEKGTDVDNVCIFGHKYTGEITDPTCLNDGYTTHTCTLCGDSYVDSYVDALGHTPGEEVRENETADGAYDAVVYCTVCGEELSREQIEGSGYLPGDINGDGAVNNKDVTRLFQYLSLWDVEVVEKALDVNGDGSVNNKDVTRLFQYLSNWDVEIH